MQVQVLGPLGVTTESGPVTIAAAKQRALLCLLAMQPNRPRAAAQLIEGLWGEDAPRTAPKTLQNYVAALRRLLPGEVLVTVPGGYLLHVDPDDVDLCRFEKLVATARHAHQEGDLEQARAALTTANALWRGAPLQDLADHEMGMSAAVRLEELHKVAEENLADVRLAAGEHQEMTSDLEASVRAEPLRERRWSQLMIALYRSGRQADALRAYQRLRQVLGEQLGIEPSPSLVALENAIVLQKPELEAVAPTEEPSPVSSPAVSADQSLHPDEVTLLFAEIKGRGLNIRLGESEEQVIEAAVTAHGGMFSRVQAGQLFGVFSEACAALLACIDAERALGATGGLRIGLDSGTSQSGLRDSPDLSEAAALASAAHGGQVLVSTRTAVLARRHLPDEVTLLDRGEFILGGVGRPARVFQLCHPDLPDSFPPLQASPALSHSLPDARTSFVGRETALAALDGLVADSRLVTILGPGGSGKTRLALEVASRAAPRFARGVVLCDLSPLSEPSLVPVSIAAAFEIRDTGGGDPLEAVARALFERRALAVLDNCEHLLEAASAAIDRLLSSAPGLTVLATSREALGVPGEHVWRIGPLRVPDQNSSPAKARESESVALFEDRARLVEPHFAISEDNSGDVAAICWSVGGLPLAIELAAARVAAFSPKAIAARLKDRSQLLATGARRATGRHATLEATIDWSYRLLDDDERRLLRTLSVFAGGFTLEAAEAVTDQDDPLEPLAALVDKSLVVWDHDAARYRLLETIRAFAAARSEECGEQARDAAAHLAWCVAFTQPLAELARTSRQAEVLAAVDGEIDNLRSAMATAETRGEAMGLWLVGRLGEYWLRRAPLEGRRWCRRLLDAVPDGTPLDVGLALTVTANCAAWIGRDLDQAEREANRAVAILENAGNTRALLEAKRYRARYSVVRYDLKACRAEYLEVRELAAKAGDRLMEAVALINLAGGELDLGGDPTSAYCRADEGLAILCDVDAPQTAHVVGLMNLARAMIASNSPRSDVLKHVVDAVDYIAELRAPMYLAQCLACISHCIARANPQDAAQLLGASLGLWQGQGLALTPTNAAEVNRARTELEQTLGADRANVLIGSTSQVTFDEALDLARLAVVDASDAPVIVFDGV